MTKWPGFEAKLGRQKMRLRLFVEMMDLEASTVAWFPLPRSLKNSVNNTTQ